MIYLDKPIDFDNVTVVVGCFVECAGEVLFLHRLDSKPEGNTWCSPGGKLDPEDKGNCSTAIARELKQETGIDVKKEAFIFIATFYVIYPNGKKFIYHKYLLLLETKPDVVLNLQEHKAFVWKLPEKAMEELELILHEGDTIQHVYYL